MLLGVIPMFCFRILRILEKNRKSAKTGKFGHYRAPMPLRREPTPRHRSTPRCQNGTLGYAAA